MTRILSQFTITRSGEDYVLHIEDEDGDEQAFSATYDQLDLITEAIDEQLNADEDDILGADEEQDDTDPDDEEDEEE